MRMDRHIKDRRGVLLLIILALLAMFGATAIGFYVIATSGNRGANASLRTAQETERPEELLNQAAAQVLRGSRRTLGIGSHSLLEDMYGVRSETGQIPAGAGPTPVAPGASGEAQVNEIPAASVTNPAQCVGCTLTFISGACAGKTTRVIGRNPANGNLYILVNGWNLLGADGAPGTSGVDDDNNTTTDDLSEIGWAGTDDELKRGDQFIVNSTPFSGTGFGFNPSPPAGAALLLDRTTTKFSGVTYGGLSWLAAFLPKAEENFDPAVMEGSPNEDYDAVDYQNWLLSTGRFLDLDDNGATPDVLIPSLHRPAVIDYWFRELHASSVLSSISDDVQRWKAILQPWGPDGTPDNADDYAPDLATGRMIANVKRMFLFRPLADDHPNFNGSNGQYTQSRLDMKNSTDIAWLRDNYWEKDGGWDVDNDGDGRPDSIWVDLGLPVRTAPDGRTYKPLFAILCVDLDGRLNLNAHGCPAQCDTATFDAIDSSPYVFGNGTTTSTAIHRGQGYGPPDINLRGLFSGSLEYSYLLYGRKLANNKWLDGRYGESYPLADGTDTVHNYDATPGGDDLLDDLRQVGPGYAVNPTGASVINDPENRNKNFECTSPYNYSDYSVVKAYGSPPDFKGSMAVGLDVRGQPLYLPLVDKGVNTDAFAAGDKPYALLTTNNPYELNLFRSDRAQTTPSKIDNPFAISEIERYLRPYDVDAAKLGSRLPILAPSLGNHRYAITTDSWSLPTAPIALPNELRNQLPNQVSTYPLAHFVYLLRVRNVPEAAWRDLIPKDLLAGQRMNLNWAFGNGRDDPDPSGNYNGVVDESSEVADPADLTDQTQWEKIRLANGTGVEVATINFDHCNSVDVDADGNVDAEDRMLARQLYARYLYVLAVLLSDNIYDPAPPHNLTLTAAEAERLAQWAVNVVDFRDRDSIMTRFDYDNNPLDGWNPTSGTVWGCERPELLLTETLALHDRRTEDLATPGGVHNTATNPDPHFDQRVYPEGSLFVELYNPSTTMEPPPGEFYYDYANQTFRQGVRLNQTTPSGDPVWRMLITEPSTAVANPADPDSSVAAEQPPAANRRSVYFVQPASAYNDGATVRYYPTQASQIAPVLPGRYAVIGPGSQGATTSSTYLGFQTADTTGQGSPAPRRIQLTPNADPNQWQVASFPFTNATTPEANDIDPASMPAQPPVSVIIDAVTTTVPPNNKPPRFSVSEPDDGYPLYNPADSTATQYPTPRDEPLDWNLWTALPTPDDGVVVRYRVIYLQRLANPLLPYNATTNPYRTVDSMQVDLCAFNGITNAAEEATVVPYNAARVFTRERGEDNEAVATNRPNLWSAEPETANTRSAFGRSTGPGVPGTLQTSHFFGAQLGHSLGWLNSPFGAPRTGGGPGDMYKGDPPTPFPWLAWANRPFINEIELLQVPSQRSSQLFRQYSIGGEGDSPYDSTSTLTDDMTDTSITLRHLFPYFRQGRPAGMPSRMYRLLECVHVPTRFSGADTTLSPDLTSTYDAGNDFMFRPPFNRVSQYREPGRVNINTVFDATVWNGILNGHAGPDYNQIRLSRRGYGATRPADCPTEFANPFRSIAGYYLVPTRGTDGIQTVIGDEVNATLLRQDQLDVVAANQDKPLFRHQTVVSDQTSNTARNPYFRYEPLQHIANLVTTKSNVYAVWITVGYFEAEKVPQNVLTALPNPGEVYPDGYYLGAELGSDTGNVERHRAFYIFDRSIPVGFQRGYDLNTGNCVLLKRFIE